MTWLILLIVIAALGVIVWYIFRTKKMFQFVRAGVIDNAREIDTQRRKQSTLISALENVVQTSFSHREDILNQLSIARQDINKAISEPIVENTMAADRDLSELLTVMRAEINNNSQLASNQNFALSVGELEDTIGKIAFARQALLDFESRQTAMLHTFPSNMVAMAFKFDPHGHVSNIPKNELEV
ncbi:MAG: LemA family protein [Pseudomonadales bacterium]|jgi:LemA protein|nr:LemA family protein [Pseudomonadales bacterium]